MFLQSGCKQSAHLKHHMTSWALHFTLLLPTLIWYTHLLVMVQNQYSIPLLGYFIMLWIASIHQLLLNPMLCVVLIKRFRVVFSALISLHTWDALWVLHVSVSHHFLKTLKQCNASSFVFKKYTQPNMEKSSMNILVDVEFDFFDIFACAVLSFCKYHKFHGGGEYLEDLLQLQIEAWSECSRSSVGQAYMPNHAKVQIKWCALRRLGAALDLLQTLCKEIQISLGIFCAIFRRDSIEFV